MSSKPVPLPTQLQCSRISLYLLPRSLSLCLEMHISSQSSPTHSSPAHQAGWILLISECSVTWNHSVREFPLSTGIPSGYSLIPELKDNFLVFWAEGPRNNKFMRFFPHPTNLKQQKCEVEWQPFNGLWVSLSESKTNKVYSEKMMTDRDALSFLTFHQAQIVRQGG